MKIEKLQPGQVVYSVERRKMGNTKLSTVGVFNVSIKEIDPEKRWVVASWNGNSPQKFYAKSVIKWRAGKPVLISSFGGMRQRLATRAEIKALKAEENSHE
jgi:hypothetical protein